MSSTDGEVDWGVNRQNQGSLGIPLGDVIHTLTNPDYRLPVPVLLEVPAGLVPDDLGMLSPETPREFAAVIVKKRMKLLTQHADAMTIRLHFMTHSQTTIGRSPRECDVVLQRESVSRKHSTVFRSDAGWRVADEGSAQGSALEGVALQAKTQAPLVGGNLLHFASYGALFLLPDQIYQLASSLKLATGQAAEPGHGQGSYSPGFAPIASGVPFREVLRAAAEAGFMEQWSSPCLLQVPVERLELEQALDPLSETMDDCGPSEPVDSAAAMTRRISPDDLKGLKQLKKVGEARLHSLAFAAGQTELVIGRHSTCDVIVAEGTASKRHARLGLGAGGEWFLIDSNSQNGTFVGGAKLPPELPILLKGGEKVWFAGYRALFLFPKQFQRLVAHSLR